MELSRMRGVGAAILFALCSFQGANAQESIEFQTKGADRTFTLKSADGTVVVIDNVTQTIFIEASDGANYEVPLETALSEAQPNATLRDEWRTVLSTASADVTLDSYVGAGSLSMATPICDPMLVYCEIQSNSNQSSLGAELDSFNAMTWGDDPNVPDPDEDPKDLDGLTVLGKRPSCGPDFSMFDAWSRCYSSGSNFGYTNPEGTVTRSEFERYKYQQFLKDRHDACQTAAATGLAYVATVPAVLASCKASAMAFLASGGTAGPLAGAVCGGAVVGLAVQYYVFARAEKQCGAAYMASGM